MNDAGKQYVKRINDEYRKLKDKPDITQSEIIERTMRLWVEKRAYELFPNEYEEMALTTIKEDIVKKFIIVD